MDEIDYWKECISIAAEECELTLTDDQLESLADSAKRGHEHYGMAFYSPPDSDRYSDIEREYKAKIKDLEQRHEQYRRNSEEAVKQALRVHREDSVSIGEHGSVYRHGGRTTQIQ